LLRSQALPSKPKSEQHAEEEQKEEKNKKEGIVEEKANGISSSRSRRRTRTKRTS